jgi:hypothetical protein
MFIHLTHDIRHVIKLLFNTPKFTRDLDVLSEFSSLTIEEVGKGGGQRLVVVWRGSEVAGAPSRPRVVSGGAEGAMLRRPKDGRRRRRWARQRSTANVSRCVIKKKLE